METKIKFNWRAFTSLYITLSFIIMIVSGIILYIAPPGRIAKWTSIPILGFEKDQWQALHTIFTFLFIIANVFHLYFNWKPFLSYLSNKRKQALRLRKELLSTIVFVIGIFCFILLDIQPFKMVMDFGESIKNEWSVDSFEPPVLHAEEMTISELAKTIKEDPQLFISRLKQHGISANLNSVVKELAQNHDISPKMVFKKMQVEGKSNTTHGGVKRGYGRMSIAQICSAKNISLEYALKKLKNEGIEASSESTLRELAQIYNISPIEFVKIIETTEAEH